MKTMFGTRLSLALRLPVFASWPCVSVLATLDLFTLHSTKTSIVLNEINCIENAHSAAMFIAHSYVQRCNAISKQDWLSFTFFVRSFSGTIAFAMLFAFAAP